MITNAGVGSARDWRVHSLCMAFSDFDLSWRGGVFAVSIVLAGIMFDGYAVFDELGVYCLIAVAAFVIWRQSGAKRWAAVGQGAESGARRQWIDPLLKGMFVLTMFYLAVETIRGIVNLPDIRVLRFTAMFLALALIAVRIQAPTTENERDKIARTIVVCAALYFFTYLSVGFIDETFFGGWRFDLQGNIWVGTSAAVLPGILLLPSLVRLGRSRKALDTYLSWAAIVIFLVTSFYYQSRLSWMALGLLTVPLIVLGRYGRAAILALGFFVLIVFSPWNDPRPATPAEIVKYAGNVISGIPATQPSYNLSRFVGIVFGAFLPTETSERIAARSAGNNTAAQVDLGTSDVDRKLAILAALKTVSSGGVGRLLFGVGYYVHRFAMLPYVHEIAAEYNYKFPQSYVTIVRTATLNGMLVDNGVVGFSLFLLLFVLVALKAGASALPFDRSAVALAASAILSLLLLGLSQFAGSNFDMMVMYLALMPSGLIASIVRGQ